MNTVRISKNNHARISTISKATGRGIREVVDSLIADNLDHLELTADQLANTPEVAALKDHPSIMTAPVDGKVYYCANCQQLVDPEEQVELCPKCGEKLDWAALRKTGWLGWSLIGLAVLLAMNRPR